MIPSRPLLLLILLAAAGCSPRPPAPQALDPAAFDGVRAFAEVRDFLAVGPRDAGTPGAAAAAAHLAARLKALGLDVETDAFEEETPLGRLALRNVLGRRGGGGAGDIVLLAAHYDTKSGIPGFQGANDSGSGVGALLELARLAQAAPAAAPGFALWFAFLDGEECRSEYGPRDGLHGSRRLAARLVEQGLVPRVRAVIVLDMIGDRDLTLTLPRNGASALLGAVLDASAEEGVRGRVALAPGEVLDDHAPFLAAGMPAVDLIDFLYGSAPGLNDYWHTPADTPDHISPESLATVGRIVVRMLNRLPPLPAR